MMMHSGVVSFLEEFQYCRYHLYIKANKWVHVKFCRMPCEESDDFITTTILHISPDPVIVMIKS